MTEALPDRVSAVLLRHNIRFVEQLLALLDSPASKQALAEALDCSVSDLESVAEDVRQRYPDLVVPQPSFERRGLGYGKRSDWQRLGR